MEISNEVLTLAGALLVGSGGGATVIGRRLFSAQQPDIEKTMDTLIGNIRKEHEATRESVHQAQIAFVEHTSRVDEQMKTLFRGQKTLEIAQSTLKDKVSENAGDIRSLSGKIVRTG